VWQPGGGGFQEPNRSNQRQKKSSPGRDQGHGRKRQSTRQGKAPETGRLPVIRPDAAGMDIGAEELWVAVPADRDPEPVPCFSAFTMGIQL
jgi:hypothetical protein